MTQGKIEQQLKMLIEDRHEVPWEHSYVFTRVILTALFVYVLTNINLVKLNSTFFDKVFFAIIFEIKIIFQ